VQQEEIDLGILIWVICFGCVWGVIDVPQMDGKRTPIWRGDLGARDPTPGLPPWMCLLLSFWDLGFWRGVEVPLMILCSPMISRTTLTRGSVPENVEDKSGPPPIRPMAVGD